MEALAMSPLERSRAALPANIRATLEASNLPVEVATAIADHCEAAFEAGYKASEEEFHAPLGTEPLPTVMLEALDITRDAVAAQAEAYVESEALALLRELNDALAIPERPQARVD